MGVDFLHAQRVPRFHQSGQSHFLTFSCYGRQPDFSSPEVCDLFLVCLEQMRRRFAMCIYGYVVMPEHVHLLVSEPEQAMLADAMHYLKLSFANDCAAEKERWNQGPFGKSATTIVMCGTSGSS